MLFTTRLNKTIQKDTEESNTRENRLGKAKGPCATLYHHRQCPACGKKEPHRLLKSKKILLIFDSLLTCFSAGYQAQGLGPAKHIGYLCIISAPDLNVLLANNSLLLESVYQKDKSQAYFCPSQKGQHLARYQADTGTPMFTEWI